MVLEIPGKLLGQSDVRETITNVEGKNVVKSIQYGVITLTDTDVSEAVSINSVVKANSMLLFLGMSNAYDTTDEVMNSFCKITLTTGTSVTATRVISDAGDNIDVRFCVIEFAEGIVKSNQFGSITVAATTNTATITTVDTTKTALSYLGHDADGLGLDENNVVANLQLTNATTVTATRGDDAGTLRINFQAIEFY